MSKDRDRVEEENLDPTVSADDATYQVGDPVDLSDPETDAPDADDVAAQIEEAELAQGLVAGTSDDDLTDAELVGDPDSDDLAGDLDGDDLDGDDLDGDDLDGDGAELTTVSAGAGSNRAKARQTGARAGVTAKKEAPTKARVATTSEGGPIARLGRFLREVVAELRKVIWPSQKQMVTYTVVVIAFLIFMVALVAGLDVLFHLVVSKVFS